MLKFVVLSVLALGCVAEHTQNFGYGFHGLGGGFRNFMGGYGSGLYGNSGYGQGGWGHGGWGHGTGRFYGMGYGGNTLGFGERSGVRVGERIGERVGERVGMTGFGERVGMTGFGLNGLSSYGLGGLGYYSPSYRFGGFYGMGHQQPLVQSYVAQPVGFTGSNLHVGQFAGVRPAISFLTQHHSEPHQEVVQAAVTQLGRTVEYKNMPYQEQPMQSQIVEVEPSETPLHIHFKTKSSSVSLSQSHQQTPAQEAQIAQTQDEPSRLVHEIQKPIIQEVREVITPYRQVTQEIQPVVEAVHTVVTKAEGQRQQYVANTQYNPSTFSSVEQKQFVQPISQSVAVQPIAQSVAVQPITSTVAVQPIASTVAVQPATAVAVQPVVYGIESSVAQPITYGYSSIAQPIVSSGIVSRGSGFTHDLSGIHSGVQSGIHSDIHSDIHSGIQSGIRSGIHSGLGYESISHPVSSSSIISSSQPFSSYSDFLGASGSSSSIRSDFVDSKRAY